MDVSIVQAQMIQHELLAWARMKTERKIELRKSKGTDHLGP